MADLNKYNEKQSLNIDTAADWAVQTRLTISSAAAVESNVSTANQIAIYSDSDVYIRFDTSSGDNIVANNDIILPALTFMTFKVPKQLGTTIYVHFKQVTSVGSKYLRLVHM